MSKDTPPCGYTPEPNPELAEQLQNPIPKIIKNPIQFKKTQKLKNTKPTQNPPSAKLIDTILSASVGNSPEQILSRYSSSFVPRSSSQLDSRSRSACTVWNPSPATAPPLGSALALVMSSESNWGLSHRGVAFAGS